MESSISLDVAKSITSPELSSADSTDCEEDPSTPRTPHPEHHLEGQTPLIAYKTPLQTEIEIYGKTRSLYEKKSDQEDQEDQEDSSDQDDEYHDIYEDPFSALEKGQEYKAIDREKDSVPLKTPAESIWMDTVTQMQEQLTEQKTPGGSVIDELFPDIVYDTVSMNLETVMIPDIIYKILILSTYSHRVSKHPYFKRLNQIHQLGGMFFINPLATHKRFEHSLGVAYLARKVCLSLQKRDHSSVTDREVILCELAGLLHDVGHGPFSHTFDHICAEILGPEHLPHEVRSQYLAKVILEQIREEKFPLTDRDIRTVQYLIDTKNYKKHFSASRLTEEQIGDCGYHPAEIMPFTCGIEQIVNNAKCQLDVDKLDYLVRDTKKLGIEQYFNARSIVQKIITRTSIIEKNWVFDMRNRENISGLMILRSTMYALQYMGVPSSLVEDKLIRILTSLNNENNFVQFTDLKDPKNIARFCSLTDTSITFLLLNTKSPRLDRAKKELMSLYQDDYDDYYVGDAVYRIDDEAHGHTTRYYSMGRDKSSPESVIKNALFHINGRIIRENPDQYAAAPIYRSPAE